MENLMEKSFLVKPILIITMTIQHRLIKNDGSFGNAKKYSDVKWWMVLIRLYKIVRL